jgi:hypothetical protein
MDEREKKIYLERFENLKKLIENEFPSDNFEIFFGTTILVSYVGSRTGAYKERTPRIQFFPGDNCMTDIDNGFEKIFAQGIAIAQNILKNPPCPDKNLQGKILLRNDGAYFEKRSL